MTKEQMMEMDTLKAAVASFDGRGGEVVFPDKAVARKARRSVVALARWYMVQLAAGIAVAIAGGSVWSDLWAQPGLLFVSGLLVNISGAAMIALGVTGLAHAVQIDVAASILETERHMARLHRIELVSGWVLGASWWVLWLPFVAVAVRLLWGADMLAPIGIGPWLVMTLASGTVGWAGMWALRRWAIGNGKTRLAARMDEMMTGRSFQEARRRIKEVAAFAGD